MRFDSTTKNCPVYELLRSSWLWRSTSSLWWTILHGLRQFGESKMNRKIFSKMLLVVALCGCGGCGTSSQETPTYTPMQESPTPLPPPVSEVVVANSAGDNTIALTAMNGDLTITCQDIVRSEEVSPYAIAQVEEGWRYTFIGRAPETEYHCSAEGYSGTVSVSTTELTEPELRGAFAAVNANSSGKWIAGSFQLFSNGYKAKYSTMVVLDAQANVRWHRQIQNPNIFSEPHLTGIPGKEFLLADNGSGIPGFVKLDQGASTALETTSTCEHDQGFDPHIVHLTQDGLVLSSKKSIVSVDDGAGNMVPSYFGWLIGIYDAQTGKLLGYLCSEELGYQRDDAKPAEEGTMYWDNPSTDTFHLNSLAVGYSVDGSLAAIYVNLKNQSHILKLDVTQGLASPHIVWKMGPGGDFTLRDQGGNTLPDGEWFSHEHGINYNPETGELCMLDNGTARSTYGGTDYSRSLCLQVNEQEKAATVKRTWTPSLSWEFDIYGSAELPDSNGRVLTAANRAYPGKSGQLYGGWFILEPPSSGTSSTSMKLHSGIMFTVPNAGTYAARLIDPAALFQTRLLE